MFFTKTIDIIIIYFLEYQSFFNSHKKYIMFNIVDAHHIVLSLVFKYL